MTINSLQTTFYGKPIRNFRPGDAVDALGSHTYRLAVDYDDEFDLVTLLDQFLAKADLQRVEALVLGMWMEAYESSIQPVLDRLIERRAELPALRALFCGDMTYEECEISWIIQGSYKPLLDAFPALEVLRIRGSSGLEIAPFEHAALKQLAIECGGLPSAIVANLAQSRMPALEWLELWLGSENYGFDGDVQTYAALLQALDASRLRYLGLRDSEITDELAVYLAAQPWLGQLDTLDLSLGTLGDAGAEALYDSDGVRQLKRLDISHHYVSAEWLKLLRAMPITLVADDPQEADDEERYVAVGE